MDYIRDLYIKVLLHIFEVRFVSLCHLSLFIVVLSHSLIVFLLYFVHGFDSSASRKSSMIVLRINHQKMRRTRKMIRMITSIH